MGTASPLRTGALMFISILGAGSLDGAPQRSRGTEARAGEKISLSGQVALADGSPPPEPAQIETICSGQRHIQGKTKDDGGFQFTLGRDPTVAMSSARVSGPAGVGSDGFGRREGGALDSLGHVDLTKCEVRAVLPGYTSNVIQLGRRSVFENPEIGILVLTPAGERSDPTVSATTLNAPSDALKAYERGIRESRRNKPNWGKAAKEFGKAVELHPQFAEAWYELGEVHLRQGEVGQASRAFQRSIEGDPNFRKPYPPLSLIELKQGNKEEAARLADKAVSLSPGLTEAHFYAAMAHFMLGNMERAGEAALVVKKQGGEMQYPRVLVILGDHASQKQDFAAAAGYYQRYIELEPGTPMAAQVRQRLEEWRSLGVIK